MAGASAQADLEPILDKAALHAVIATNRAVLERVEVEVVVDRAITQFDFMSGFWRSRLAWDPGAMRWEECAVPSADPASCAAPTIQVASKEVGLGLSYDIAGRVASALAIDRFKVPLTHDYFGLTGFWPNAVVCGFEPPPNDALKLLSDSGTTVRPEMEIIDGHACVVAEWRGELPLDGPPVVTAAFVPELGYAQLLYRVNHPRAGDIVEWRVTEFGSSGGDMAVPLAGAYTYVNGDGTVAEARTITVALDESGAPKLVLGADVPLGVELPAGTSVYNAAGETWDLEAPMTVTPALLASARTDDSDVRLASFGAFGGWALAVAAGLGLVALVAARRRGAGRRALR